MAWTLCTSGSAVRKAGANANSTIIGSGSALQDWSDKAEGTIIANTRRDWRVDYSSLNADVKNILADVASSLIAMNLISYDMSGYTSRAEAQTMLDFLDDNASKGMKILHDFKSNTIKSVD